MATVGNLPEEMMIEILSRLPPDSLSRSKSVCNYWYALINSLQHKSVLLLRNVRMDFRKIESIFSILNFPLDLDRPVSVLDFDFPFNDDFNSLDIHGHSHGLVCLSDSTDIYLCNPTIREFRKLPPSILLLTERSRQPDGFNSLTDAIGFGYDAKSRDFKVVRVVDFVQGAGYLHSTRVEIYELSKDRWREIESSVCGHVFWTPSFEMYHEGTYYCYWWANAEGVIQSFDMSEEVFGQISVPESFKESPEKHRSMGFLNGSIVLFHYPWEGNGKTFDIWEMEKNELGVVSWAKLLTIISPVSGIEIDNPLLFVSSDELLMETNKGEVILYNIKTKQIKTQPIKELPIKVHQRLRDHLDMEATSFVENLLSIERSHCGLWARMNF